MVLRAFGFHAPDPPAEKAGSPLQQQRSAERDPPTQAAPPPRRRAGAHWPAPTRHLQGPALAELRSEGEGLGCCSSPLAAAQQPSSISTLGSPLRFSLPNCWEYKYAALYPARNADLSVVKNVNATLSLNDGTSATLTCCKNIQGRPCQEQDQLPGAATAAYQPLVALWLRPPAPSCCCRCSSMLQQLESQHGHQQCHPQCHCTVTRLPLPSKDEEAPTWMPCLPLPLPDPSVAFATTAITKHQTLKPPQMPNAKAGLPIAAATHTTGLPKPPLDT
ncbi:uncharacterized protein LOC125614067 [Marmota marmota marmota]|uniref:uncharacterized protein LOC125614067 n=1 Tax=Marmota marmota marmota TaxID=9994 RepID=UPI00209383DC|nr:uncharacterized protein LOC125614067 [Marmota marmota marmota]